MNKIGLYYCVISACLFGFAPLISKHIYAQGMDTIGLAFYRTFLALPFLFVVLKRKHKTIKINKIDLKKVLLVGVFGSVLTTYFLNSSYLYIDTGMATSLHFLHPVFVMLMAIIFYKEKLNIKKALPLIPAIGGVLMFINFKDTVNFWGICLALLSGCTYGFYILSIDKLKLNKIDSTVLSFWTALTAAVCFFCIGIFQGSLYIFGGWKTVILLIVNSVVCQVLAVTLLQKGIGLLGSQTASLMSLFEPLTGIIVGCLFLHEEIGTTKIIGCILVFTAVIMRITSEQKS